MAQKKATLSDDFSLRGYWWDPRFPQNRVSGDLSFGPEGVSEISLDGLIHDESKSVSFPPFIHGETLDGKTCTVIDAFEITRQHVSGSPSTSKLCFNRLLIGNETVDPRNTRFESAVIGLDNLGGWMYRDPFRYKPSKESNISKHNVVYERPRIISFYVPFLDANARLLSTFNIHREYQNTTMSHHDMVRIQPRKKQLLDWYMDVIYGFRVFLSLLLNRPANLTSIAICPRKHKNSRFKGKMFREYAELCFHQVGRKVNKAVLPIEIPFTYSRVRKEFPKLMENWYQKAEKLRTVWGLYFGVAVNEGTPVDFQFLALIQAIEAYHRYLGTDKYLSDKEYDKVQKNLVMAIPKKTDVDLRTALKSRIKFGNEYSLRKRLVLMLAGLPAEIRRSITLDDKGFVGKIVATRNYLTHRDETQKSDILDSKGIFNAAESLQCLVTCLLLEECGIPISTIQDAMLNHWSIKNRRRIA